MKYYHLRNIACLTACVLSLLCAGCGGSKSQGISVCEPVNLADSYSDWQEGREAQVDRLTERIEDSVRSRLEEMCAEYRTAVGK